jgi:Type IV secretion system pilin
MLKKIKSHLLIITSILTLAVPVIAPAAMASAACSTNTATQISDGASQAGGDPNQNCASTGVDSTGIGHLASSIVNIFSIVVGAVAVIMIIYGGFRYITSGGDSNAVGGAKNTLIYAIIGLVIVALAQVIVHFVLNQTSSVTGAS